MTPIAKICRERAETYGAMRHTALTAITLDRAADEIERLTANGIHSCHDHCDRPMCVQRRRIAELEGALRRIGEMQDGEHAWYARDIANKALDGSAN